jgi:hypothetical protein
MLYTILRHMCPYVTAEEFRAACGNATNDIRENNIAFRKLSTLEYVATVLVRCVRAGRR